LEVRRGTLRVAVGGPQQRALLTVLLLNAHRVAPVDRLVEQLWARTRLPQRAACCTAASPTSAGRCVPTTSRRPGSRC